MAASTLNTAACYVACFISALGSFSANSVIVGWASSTLRQTEEKRAVVLAITNVFGYIGYIYGAYLWPAAFYLLRLGGPDVVDAEKLEDPDINHGNLYSY
ncbi:hypothetical protein F5Y06DRAFT_250120 [Hypoxylon sp. FL0890]|nr:hypothetical protein F5Y06DRAFT_250120 [Hypoxylon sp. FL0890]